eukprot:4105630-Prymnesium_polylepis.1
MGAEGGGGHALAVGRGRLSRLNRRRRRAAVRRALRLELPVRRRNLVRLPLRRVREHALHPPR